MNNRKTVARRKAKKGGWPSSIATKILCTAIFVLSMSFTTIYFYQKLEVDVETGLSFEEETRQSEIRMNGILTVPKKDYYQQQQQQQQQQQHVSQKALLYNKKSLQHLLHRGRVVKELCQRVLSRSIAQSNVLVVTPDAGQVLNLDMSVTESTTASSFIRKNQQSQNDSTTENSIRYNHDSVISTATSQGHQTHIVPPSNELNTWWKSNKKNDLGWILLAYFIPGDDGTSDIDQILSPVRSSDLLSGSTITYIVFQVSSYVDKQEGGSYTYSYSGLTAAQTLLNANYKVQVLASTHFGKEDEEEEEEDNDQDDGDGGDDSNMEEEEEEESWEDVEYPPNYLLKSPKDIEKFLKGGANLASKNPSEHIRFDSLLFATQGLDLAIPSRLSYIDIRQLKACTLPYVKKTQRCDSKLDGRALDNNVFIKCPKRHQEVSVHFDSRKGDGNQLIVRHKNKRLEESPDVVVWRGHSDPAHIEAACVKVFAQKDTSEHMVDCVTRVIPQPLHVGLNSSANNGRNKYNVLSILIDPLSRNQMLRSLPNTSALLKRKGFVNFEKYSVIGDNSGPNQSALFSGLPLEGGRNGIKSSSSHGDKQTKWLWDRLGELGYATLKAEDGCIENSNMVQSQKPRTTHGSQLYNMFCFDYDRPACLGKKLLAKHLIQYAGKFIDAYGNQKEIKRPWAAFLSFVDSHEDSLTLISYLDELLFDFLHDISLSDTIILFISDHGLHYGPSFQSSSGVRERAEPVLSIHLPEELLKQKGDTLNSNAKLWTTPYDVHETILDAVLGTQRDEGTIGQSLLRPLPQSHEECHGTVPERYCDLVKHHDSSSGCTFMVDPPSVFSFYSDIPRGNRPKWPNCKSPNEGVPHLQTFSDECDCYTAAKRWHKCEYESREEYKNTLNQDIENVAFISCGESPFIERGVDVVIKRNEKLVKRSRENRDTRKATPNVLFIEIDSVSFAAAERNYPETLKILKKHEISVDNNQENSCPSGFCGANFLKTSVVGQNSIPNQLAALSGCFDRNVTETEPNFSLFLKEKFEVWCANFQVGKSRKNPWLFEVAEKQGYITFFGEEFCYKASPFIVQRPFANEYDFQVHETFCLLAEDIKKKEELDEKTRLWSIEHDAGNKPQPCVDGRSWQEMSLEYIKGMWEVYPDIPKFAYLNALAAHDYSLDLAYQTLGSEAYDVVLSAFLNEMLSRPDANNTIIVLRSDHGLQGGPAPVDYSTQVEHMRPWNTMIVPEQYTSVDTLQSNQDKLVTGFDLYKTLKALIENKERTVNNVDWTYNLLNSKVPEMRSCKDARIPTEFCPCTEERTDLMPYFYIANAEGLSSLGTAELEEVPDGLGRLRPEKLAGVGFHEYKRRKEAKPKFVQRGKMAKRKLPIVSKDETDSDRRHNRMVVQHDVVHQQKITSPATATCTDSFENNEMLKETWKEINQLTDSFPQSKISGGLFLYERQQMLLARVIKDEIQQTQKNNEPFRICETGFGAGHSAAFFLSLSDNIEVHTFDKFDRPYQPEILRRLKMKFGSRLHSVKGDSCKTLPTYLKKDSFAGCDFLHGSSLCQTDNLDLISHTTCGTVLTSTAMDSLLDKAVYFGPKAQWRKLRDDSCIRNVTCYSEETKDLDQKYVFAKKDQKKIMHKFCFAQSTGQCHDGDGGQGEGNNETECKISNPFHLLCPEFQVVVPQ